MKSILEYANKSPLIVVFSFMFLQYFTIIYKNINSYY